ncbi:MAG TPA: arsenosugar biosynthesis radical SAM protein ArsS [Planctomycetota bacterium]|nr:arsenosugar biosynthesis radical SAM protein ArsS [Planctomycetota bacterium]
MDAKFERETTAVIGEAMHCTEIDCIQVNLGLRCNQSCGHCHLEASPDRSEAMDWPAMELVLEAARASDCRQVDITGGAPELHPLLRRFIAALREAQLEVAVRTSFTALLEPGAETLPEFFREHRVALIGSLPCYLQANVDAQRGEGTYQRSLKAMRRLNVLGYGRERELPLDLVHNPTGPFLPPNQETLEADYRLELERSFGLFFTRLQTVTNMPIGRFLTALRAQGVEPAYRQILESTFNPNSLDGLICRHGLSVRWDGALFDCDFNLALGMGVHHGVPNHLDRFEPLELAGRKIVTGAHCFGCTAGHGSGCRGAISAVAAAQA